jgi:hypothetical protein
MGLEGVVSKRLDAPYRSGRNDMLGKDEDPRLPQRSRRIARVFHALGSSTVGSGKVRKIANGGVR